MSLNPSARTIIQSVSKIQNKKIILSTIFIPQRPHNNHLRFDSQSKISLSSPIVKTHGIGEGVVTGQGVERHCGGDVAEAGRGGLGTGCIVVGDRDGYRGAPRGNCQELRGEIKAAPVFRHPHCRYSRHCSRYRSIYQGRANGCPPLTGSVSLCHRNRNARFVVRSPLSLYLSALHLLSILRLSPFPCCSRASTRPSRLPCTLYRGGRRGPQPRQGSAKWTLRSRLY